MKGFKLIVCLLFVSSFAFAQETALMSFATSPDIKLPRLNLGAEVQWYPAGWIYGARADLYLGKHTNWNFRLAYNNTNRKDFSRFNDEETGGGFGGSLGYRHYLGKRKGLFYGGRLDVWNLDIDWKNFDDMGEIKSSGTSEITVIQPTAELGYQFVVDRHWIIAPALAAGYELNAITKGEKVEGKLITLIGVNIGYKLF